MFDILLFLEIPLNGKSGDIHKTPYRIGGGGGAPKRISNIFRKKPVHAGFEGVRE